MDVKAYLKRIGYRGSMEPDARTLLDLHRAHMFTVPFENLDIHLGRPIVLNDEALFEKIVARRRGGFCYELNGLFCALLRALGFQVSMLCARVARAEDDFGPPFDHMTLLVQLDRPWIADVGFGDSFIEPLLLEPKLRQYQWGRTCRILSSGEDLLYQSRSSKGRWNSEYKFGLTPYQYEDFGEMCLYHQTSPQSSFTRKRVCSRATPDGRVTISDRKLILTRNGVRVERELKDGEYAVALREYFGVVLGGSLGS
ncbi:MAG TPA: arylamine N-acetyltransferase [Acidobacteriota bacterium]|nr:arylamine N-acetyltransferase [Acidobacteriota bacterium]